MERKERKRVQDDASVRVESGGEGGIHLQAPDLCRSKYRKYLYLNVGKHVSRISIRSVRSSLVCLVLSRNRHQIDTKRARLCESTEEDG